MKLFALITAAVFLLLLKTNAQNSQQEAFMEVMKVIFNEKSIAFEKQVIPDLGNPDVIILKSNAIENIYEKDILIKEISNENPRIFILDNDYIFGYKPLVFIEFSEIKIGDKKALLKIKVNQQGETKRFEYFLKMRKEKWSIDRVRK